MGKTLQDRVAIVTGGGQGLGEAICKRLAHEGCHVVVADIQEETAAETAMAITEDLKRQGDVGRRAIGGA